MAYVPFANCVEVVLRFIWGEQVVSITLGFCKAAPPNETDIDGLYNSAILPWYNGNLKLHLSSNITLVNTNITILTTSTSMSKDYAASIAGTGAATSVANNVTGVVTFSTPARGRSYRGRNYIPGIPTTFQANNTELTSAAVTAYLGDYAALATLAGALGWTHVVLSRFSNLAQRPVGVATGITAYTMDIFIDSQRRRLAGRGE